MFFTRKPPKCVARTAPAPAVPSSNSSANDATTLLDALDGVLQSFARFPLAHGVAGRRVGNSEDHGLDAARHDGNEAPTARRESMIDLGLGVRHRAGAPLARDSLFLIPHSL